MWETEALQRAYLLPGPLPSLYIPSGKNRTDLP